MTTHLDDLYRDFGYLAAMIHNLDEAPSNGRVRAQAEINR